MGRSTPVSRRSVLRASGAGLALPLVAGVGRAAATTGRVTDLGPGVLGSPIVGAAVSGARAYVVTRGLTPAVVGELDLVTGRVLRNIELPTGDGGWGAVATPEAVYTGMYPVADVHRVDRATGAVSSFPRLGGEQFAFDLARSPDGRLYAGTYPHGKVYELDPATGGVRDLGPAEPGLKYVRSVAVGPDGTVYAGTGTPARLIAIDPVAGARRQLLPAELLAESFVYDIAVSADVIVAGTEPGGRLVVIDRTDPDRYTVVATGERTVDAIAIDGRTVWFTARSSGALYSYDLDAATPTRVGVPLVGEETRGVFVFDGAVHGVSGSGLWWRWADGKATVIDLQQAGLRAGPEPPQSVASVAGEQVLVGGNFGLAVHELTRGTVTRLPMNGEAKTMAPVRGKTYLAVYPGAFVEVYDHRTGSIELVGEIGGESNRPRDSCYDPSCQLLAIGTRNQYGRTGGALAVVDPASGRIDRYDGLVPDQAIAAVTAHRGVTYLVTEIAADGVAPKATEAAVVAFDLVGRAPLWTWKPVAAAAGYASLQWHDGLLYGVTTDGRLFVGDPGTRTVRATGSVAPGRPGQFALRADGVYLVTSEALLRVGSDASVTQVVGGLAGQWYNEPQLAVDEETGDVFTLRGRNLIRIEL
jgi:hypothetical protein